MNDPISPRLNLPQLHNKHQPRPSAGSLSPIRSTKSNSLAILLPVPKTKRAAKDQLRRKQHLLSTRVDFFDDKNSRRLKIQQKMRVLDMKPPLDAKKQDIYRSRSTVNGAGGKLINLVERIIFPKVETEKSQPNFLPISSGFLRFEYHPTYDA